MLLLFYLSTMTMRPFQRCFTGYASILSSGFIFRGPAGLLAWLDRTGLRVAGSSQVLPWQEHTAAGDSEDGPWSCDVEGYGRLQL